MSRKHRVNGIVFACRAGCYENPTQLLTAHCQKAENNWCTASRRQSLFPKMRSSGSGVVNTKCKTAPLRSSVAPCSLANKWTATLRRQSISTVAKIATSLERKIRFIFTRSCASSLKRRNVKLFMLSYELTTALSTTLRYCINPLHAKQCSFITQNISSEYYYWAV